MRELVDREGVRASRVARVYLWWVLTSTLLVDRSKTHEAASFIELLRRPVEAGRYAWGAAALAHLYRDLGMTSRRKCRQLGVCATLLLMSGEGSGSGSQGWGDRGSGSQERGDHIHRRVVRGRHTVTVTSGDQNREDIPVTGSFKRQKRPTWLTPRYFQYVRKTRWDSRNFQKVHKKMSETPENKGTHLGGAKSILSYQKDVVKTARLRMMRVYQRISRLWINCTIKFPWAKSWKSTYDSWTKNIVVRSTRDLRCSGIWTGTYGPKPVEATRMSVLEALGQLDHTGGLRGYVTWCEGSWLATYTPIGGA